MTIEILKTLPIGAELILRGSGPVFLAGHSRDTKGRVLVSTSEQLHQRFRVAPRQLKSNIDVSNVTGLGDASKQGVGMKDGSLLFKEVDERIYQQQFARLEAMRKTHPTYRDDQLLLKLLCDDAAILRMSL